MASPNTNSNFYISLFEKIPPSEFVAQRYNELVSFKPTTAINRFLVRMKLRALFAYHLLSRCENKMFDDALKQGLFLKADKEQAGRLFEKEKQFYLKKAQEIGEPTDVQEDTEITLEIEEFAKLYEDGQKRLDSLFRELHRRNGVMAEEIKKFATGVPSQKDVLLLSSASNDVLKKITDLNNELKGRARSLTDADLAHLYLLAEKNKLPRLKLISLITMLNRVQGDDDTTAKINAVKEFVETQRNTKHPLEHRRRASGAPSPQTNT